MAPRQAALAALLAATLAAVWWVGREEAEDAPEVVGAVAPRRGAEALPSRPETVPPAAEAGRPAGVGPENRFTALGPDLFPVQTWRPPPRPVVLPPPPPPQAPPVPYKYLGRWQEDGAEVIFLAEGNQTRAARRGDRLGQWRVEDIRGDTMTLLYLPLEQTRTLRLAP